MRFEVDVDNGMPIYEQLIWQVKYAVATGTLTRGMLVPSVREVSKQLAINPNTVQRAYQQLQQESILESLRGRGLAVCSDAKKRCVSDRQTALADRLTAIVREAIRSGLTVDRLREMFEQSLRISLAEDAS